MDVAQFLLHQQVMCNGCSQISSLQYDVSVLRRLEERLDYINREIKLEISSNPYERRLFHKTKNCHMGMSCHKIDDELRYINNMDEHISSQLYTCCKHHPEKANELLPLMRGYFPSAAAFTIKYARRPV